MWHYFIALAFVAVLAVWGWLKHRAITTFTGALWNRGDKWLWGFFKRKLETVAPPTPQAPTPANEKTYHGIFQEYIYNPPSRRFFTLLDGETTVQVPVVRVNTNLLTSLHRGDLVEIDTKTGVYIGEEVVLRVRVKRKVQT
jgi:hypothetical protein